MAIYSGSLTFCENKEVLKNKSQVGLISVPNKWLAFKSNGFENLCMQPFSFLKKIQHFHVPQLANIKGSFQVSANWIISVISKNKDTSIIPSYVHTLHTGSNSH